MGFFDKISNVFSNLGSKITSGANYISHKIPIVKSVIETGRGILNTASNIAQSEPAKTLAGFIPYGEQVRQGVIRANDVVNKGANLFNSVADAVQGVASQVNKEPSKQTSRTDILESITPPPPDVPDITSSIIPNLDDATLSRRQQDSRNRRNPRRGKLEKEV